MPGRSDPRRVVFELTLNAGGFFVEELGQVPEEIVEVESNLSRDQFLRDLGQIRANECGLVTYVERRIARPKDECGLPTCGNRAERIPGMAGDEAQV